ncbi:MAG: hypothetical protein Q9208_004998 [Pyrenodesmia sp. 3 TL-2023]
MRDQLKRALLAAGLANYPLGALAVDVTLTSKVSYCPTPTGGPGTSGSGSSGTVSTVSSTYGVYTLLGCYAAPSSGYLLDGKTTVSTALTLASCASFCAGSLAFAVQNGNQCLCGSKGPIAAPLGAGSCTTKCSGNAAEDCGSNSSAVVYISSPQGGQVSATTYQTTLSNGVVSTVTSSSTLPPSPSASVSASTFTTTDARGSSTVVTSSTTVTPAPAGSTSATTFVTTNAAGSSFTTSRTTVNPPPASTSPATSVIVQSSTNAQGSVIVTSSTSTASVPFSSSACGGTYSDRLGDLYHVDCGIDYPGYDLSTLQVADFESCLQACDNYVPSAAVAGGAGCVGVSAGYRTAGVECYLKSNVVETRFAVGSDSAYRLDSNVNPQPPAASSGLPSNPITSSPVTLPVGPSSNPVNVPSPRPSASTSAANVNPTAALQPCPLSDGQPFVDQQGTVFDIQCQVQYPGFDLTTPHFDTFQECILACDNYVPDPAVAGGADCVAVTWGFGNVGGNCYLKSNVGEVRPGGPNDASARLRNGAVSPSPLPIPLPTPTSSSAANVPQPSTNPIDLITAALPCPASDGLPFVNEQGTVFDIACQVQYPGNDLTTPHFDTFRECILACDNYVPDPAVAGGQGCVAVTWGFGNVGGNCYLKSAVGEVRAGSPNDASARLRTAALPNPGSIISNLPLPATSIIPNIPLPATSIIPNIPLPATSILPLPNPGTVIPPLPATSILSVPLPNPATIIPSVVPNPATIVPSVVPNPATIVPSVVPDPATIIPSVVPDPATIIPSVLPDPATIVPSVVPDPATVIPTVVPDPATVIPSVVPIPPTVIPSVLPDPDPIVPSLLPIVTSTIPSLLSTILPTLPATTILNVPLPGVPLPGPIGGPAPSSVSSSAPAGPSQISGSATCPDQNGAIYTNRFGNQYELFCGVEINGDNALQAAHADTFEDCVAFCDLLPGCTAITYPGDVGIDNAFRSNCYPYTSFIAFTSPNVPTLRSARPINGGSNTGTRFNDPTLCPANNGQTYIDEANGQHRIACGSSYASTGDLYATVLPTLDACVTYCSLYDACVAVTFTGFIAGNRAPNCYPRSTTTAVGALTLQLGNSTAFTP